MNSWLLGELKKQGLVSADLEKAANALQKANGKMLIGEALVEALSEAIKAAMNSAPTAPSPTSSRGCLVP
jgi:hypothetical protein